MKVRLCLGRGSATIIAFVCVVGIAACGGSGGGGGDGGFEAPAGVGLACTADQNCSDGLVCQSCVQSCTGSVRRCAGLASAEPGELISLEDGLYPAGCVDMSGSWRVTEEVDGGCEAQDPNGPFFVPLDGRSTARIDFVQSGCNLSYTLTAEGVSVVRKGRVVGSRFRLKGPFLVDAGIGLSCSTNEAFVDGDVVGASFDAVGTGAANCTAAGATLMCDGLSGASGIR